jgi:L-rhamnose isomerase
MDYTRRPAMLEEMKGQPWAAAWDYYCLTQEAPVGMAWYDQVVKYEKEVLCGRGSVEERAPVAVLS